MRQEHSLGVFCDGLRVLRSNQLADSNMPGPASEDSATGRSDPAYPRGERVSLDSSPSELPLWLRSAPHATRIQRFTTRVLAGHVSNAQR